MTADTTAPFDLSDADAPDLYALLQVARTATGDELRKAYRKLALLTHPDKHAHLPPSEAQKATARFQQIGFAYTLLSDARRRKIYDQTGSIKDISDIIEDGQSWDAYFRELWTGIVDASTIEQFAKVYKGSEEEQADILAAYTTHAGDLDLIFTEVLLAEVDDEPRFVEIIEKAIDDKKIKRTKAYKKSKKLSSERRAKANDEAEEAEALRKELGLDEKLRKIKKDSKKSGKRKRSEASDDDENSDDGAFKALIRQRETSRMSSIIASIEEKYVKNQPKKAKTKSKGKKKGKGDEPTTFEEPTEEEFQALQAKLFAKK
ncbi:hypothetical protein GGI15_003617 [Coemansia interrupta]|uniref:J domain-containing protein n=1 Tax=Coemansia interrupta TaxID=1126814 RepID=A0A9W8HBQ6_9FUNG|nr:hypothetical protein GGI15_003617 [Coemansia interrupta]